jgi:hypothetical protein
VVYDTAVATSPPIPVVNSGPNIPAPERRAEQPAGIREALAELRPSDAKIGQSVHSVRPASRSNHRRSAAKRLPLPMFMPAQRQFGGYMARMW